MFMYSYCIGYFVPLCCSVYCLCANVYCATARYTVLLPPDFNPISINKLYHISYHVLSSTVKNVARSIELPLVGKVRTN